MKLFLVAVIAITALTVFAYGQDAADATVSSNRLDPLKQRILYLEVVMADLDSLSLSVSNSVSDEAYSAESWTYEEVTRLIETARYAVFNYMIYMYLQDHPHQPAICSGMYYCWETVEQIPADLHIATKSSRIHGLIIGGHESAKLLRPVADSLWIWMPSSCDTIPIW